MTDAVSVCVTSIIRLHGLYDSQNAPDLTRQLPLPSTSQSLMYSSRWCERCALVCHRSQHRYCLLVNTGPQTPRITYVPAAVAGQRHYSFGFQIQSRAICGHEHCRGRGRGQVDRDRHGRQHHWGQ